MNILEVVKADVKENHEGYLREVVENGCQSGVVTGLIYYHDTLKFYETHKEEINGMLSEVVEETGLNAFELLRGLDPEDQLMQETNNQNILAWFGYETRAMELYQG
jgi:hypothetical protein